MKHALRITHKHAWKRWGILPLLLSIALTFVIVATVSAAVAITATKTDTFVGIHDGDGKADPGETIEYTVVVTNSGDTDATGVAFNDIIDANTTLVPGSLVVSPLALDETYSSVGNMTLTSSAINPTCGGNPLRSITCNDLINGSTLVGFGATQPTANGTIVNGSNTVTTSNSGTVLLNTDGTFVYNPAAGFEGADGFWYTLSNSVGNDNAHVTINVGGANGMVWFISSAGGGSGRQANPFTLAAFNTANTGVGTNPADGDTVFLFEGAHTGPVTLRNNQTFIGQDATVSVQTLGGPTAQPGNTYPAINPTGATVAITSAGIGVTLGSGNNIAGLTVGNATTAINGGAVGTLKVREVTINTNGSGLIISTSGTITTDATFTGFTGITTTGGTNGISLTGVGGTLNTGGSLSGASGATFDVSGGTVSSTYSGSVTQGNNAPMVSIAGGHSGTITFQTGTLNATNGTGLQFSNADGIYNFNGTTTLNGGDAGVDITTGSAGTLTFASGTAITNPSGIAYREDTSTANVIYNGTITKINNANNAVDINAKTGGATSFVGAITASTTAANAIDLTNTGGTVNFSGGLNITTTSGVGFNAAGTGATINVCDENPCNPGATGALVNTLTTTTGTALNVANTTIGSNKLEFRRISANGAVNGIVLNNTGTTSGGLTVTGDGTGSANGSGGTIINTTGTGINLTTTRNVSLTQLNISNTGLYGINISSVTNFTYQDASIINAGDANEENTIQILNLFGTTSKIEDVTLDEIQEDGIQIRQNTTDDATRDELTIRRLNLQDHQAGFGEAGIEIQPDLASNFKLLVDDSDFAINANAIMGVAMSTAASHTGTITVIVQDNIFNATASFGSGAIQALGGGSGTANYAVTGNTITSTKFDGIRINNDDTGTTNTIISNNIITGSGASNNGEGITLRQDQNGTLNALISGNNISQIKANGIRLQSSDDTTNDAGVEFSATVTNNSATVRSDGFGAGLLIDVGDGSGVAKNDVCADISGNTLSGTELAVFFDYDITLQLNETADASLRIRQTSDANLTSVNNSASVSSFANAPNTITYNGGICAQPPVIAMAPNNNLAFVQHQADGYPMAYAHASNTDSNSATAFAPVYDLGSMYQPAAWVTPNEQSVSPAAAISTSNAGGDTPRLLAPPTMPALSGETVNVPIGTLPAGKRVTIKFRVTVDPLDPGEIRTRILNQSNVSYTGGPVGGIDTTDPAPSADLACTAAPAIGTQTCTPVDRPDTTVSSINRQTPLGANTNAGSVTWRVTFADAISGLTSSNFTLLSGGTLIGTSITSVTAVGGAPATQWDVLVNTGSGDGLLELNMTSAAALSHDVLGLPFTTGQDYTIDRTAPTVASILRQSPASNPTNADVLVFRITFNEAVQGVGANSFIATGTTTPVDPSVSSVTPNLVFDFSVDGTGSNGDLDNLNGTVGLNVSPTPTITDLAGNTLQVVEPTPAATNDQTYTLDNTAPTVTNVSSTSADGTYTTGAVIPVVVTLSEPVTVIGTPQLTLETGATDRVVNYTSGSGTSTLTFNYTVQAGDSSTDLDYLSTTALALNGGTIQDAATNNATLTLPAPGAAGSLGANKAIVIDTTAPTVTNVSSTSADGTYTTGAIIPVTVTFSEPVTVIGTPQLTLETGATDQVADYTSGSGTTTLTFNYTVQAGDSSADLEYLSTTALALNGGTIRDAATNDAALTLPAPGAAGSLGANKAIVIDTTAPTVTNVTSSTANGTYGTGATISIQVTFNEPVTVAGTPQLTLETGTTDQVVNYTSGSGTDTLTFTYTTQTGDTSPDLDYVGTTSLTLNGGTIRDVATNNATLTLPAPGAAGSLGFNKAIVIDATEPFVTNVTSTAANGSYNASAVIPITVQFSEAVTVIGTPQLTLETGATDAVVNYASGSGTDTLTFNYTVVSGNNSLDLDYVGTTSLTLNSGTIKDASSNDAILTLPAPGAAGSLGANKAIVIDTIPPIMINNVTSSAANGSYTTGAVIPISITYSEVVFVTGTPQLTLETGATDQVVDYSSGSGTTTLTFNYTVQAGDTSADLDYISASALALNGGTIQDAATNNAILTLPAPGTSGSLGATKSIVIDTTAPTVTNVSSTSADGTYTTGAVIPVTVTFSEPVTVIGTPQLTLETGATDEVVNYTGGSGTATLTFNYTVQAGDTSADLDYISTTALALNGGTIQDAATNDATLTLPAPGAAGSLGANKALVIDTTAPTVTNVTSTSADGTYTTGAVIPVTVTFSEPVTVTGTPQLTLETGTTDQVVDYTSGSSTTTLTFNYTVQAGDNSLDLDYVGTTALALNGGTIQDAAINDADLTLAAPGTAGSLEANKALVIDTTAPTVTNVTSTSANGIYTTGAVIPVVVTFNENVTVSGTPQLTLETGTTDQVVDYTSGSGTATLTFNYTVQAGDTSADLDYIGATALALNGGTIQDAAANNATLTLPAPGAAGSLGANKAIVIDAVAPNTTITANPANPTNSTTANFDFTGSDGSGTVASFECNLDGGGFSACTSTKTYTLLADGSHTFQVQAIDTAGNVDPTPASFTWIVDTTAPTVVVSSVTTSPTNSSPIVVTITFSEPVTGFTASTAAGDLNITNGTDSNPTGSGATYTFDLTPSSQGPVTVVVPSSSAFDASTNPNTASNTFSITYDIASPDVTINQAAGQANPTGVAPINFTAVFTESVTGFDALDVNLGGTAGATTAFVTEIAPMDGTTYNVAVSGMTLSGTVIASIPAGAAQDAAINVSNASTSTDNTVTFDPVVPVVTGIVRADPSPTNAASVSYTVTFAKNVSGVDASDFTFTTSGVTGAAITNVAGSGTTWTVTVSTGTGDGTLRLDLVDDDTIVDSAGNQLGGTGAGNGDFTSGEVYTIDKTGPSVVAIVRANASPTNAATVDFTVTFSETVTGVDTSDFSLTTSGVTGAAITGVTGSGTTWTATVSTGSGSGTIGLNLVDDDTIIDVVGNPLGGTGTGNGNFTGEVYTIDKTAPQAGNLVATNVITGGGSTQTFTIVFSDNLALDTASLDGSDIRVTGPSGFNQPATFVSVTPATNGTPRTATYQISAPGGSWDNADNGAYTVALQANQVADTAGNTVAASALGTFNVDVSVARRLVYLPLMLHSVAQVPDLVVSSVTLNPNKTTFTAGEPIQISVVIKNQGNAAATPFWVDLYLNPSSTPALNQLWNKICGLNPCYGIAWQINQPLAAGAELTLTSTVGSYAADYTRWPGGFVAGTTDLYVQADSWNPGKDVGASGDTNTANNLFHISGLHVTGQNVAGAGADVAIPARPR